jgi:hypothetical protein
MEDRLQATVKTYWRWYAALLIANTLDLLLTYTALERGIPEWNPLLRPLILTPWPPVMKLLTFGLLAHALWLAVQRVQRTRPVLSLLQSATVVYLLVVVVHVVGLYISGSGPE